MGIATRPDLVVVPNNTTPADRSVEKRRLRRHLILNVIREHGPLSRADISKLSGYNLPNVSSLVDELVSTDLVHEMEAQVVPRGRRPIPVYLNENYAGVLGIDVGKSTTISLIVNLAGKVISRFEHPTPQLDSVEAHANWVLEVSERALEGSNVSIPPLCGIGVGLPGLILKKSGESIQTRGSADAISTALSGRFHVPVVVENDARMMAFGSIWFGTGRKYSHFAVINLGLGIGMGLVLDGRVFTGKQGFAGELGFVPLGEKGVNGFMGHPEALENTASGAGLMRLAKKKKLKVKDVAELATMAREGNQKAKEIFDEFAEALARGLAAIINLFDPDAIILSGRVTRAADVFLDRTRAELERHALEPILKNTEILISPLDVDLGPLGAAASVLQLIFRTSHVQVDEVI